jgi:hypothetical protein
MARTLIPISYGYHRAPEFFALATQSDGKLPNVRLLNCGIDTVTFLPEARIS